MATMSKPASVRFPSSAPSRRRKSTRARRHRCPTSPGFLCMGSFAALGATAMLAATYAAGYAAVGRSRVVGIRGGGAGSAAVAFGRFGGYGLSSPAAAARSVRRTPPSIVVRVRGGGSDDDNVDDTDGDSDSDDGSGGQTSDGGGISSEYDVDSDEEVGGAAADTDAYDSNDDGASSAEESSGDEIEAEEDDASSDIEAEDEIESESNVDVLSSTGEVLFSATEKEIEEEAAAKSAASLSQQSRNLAISTALFLSLFFDSILNKAKRSVLFPSDLSSAALRLVPTASIASGFALAAGVAFLLWRDSDARSAAANGEGESADSFLALRVGDGENDDDDDDGELVSRLRRRLYLHSSLFGILNLGAHLGHGAGAPFLGASSAAINFHNAMASVNAFSKEVRGRNMFSIAVEVLHSMVGGLFGGYAGRGSSGGGGNGSPQSVERDEVKRSLNSFAFQVSAVVAWVRFAQTVVSITSGGNVFGGAVTTDAARHIALQWASLAKYSLAAGVALTLKEAAENDVLSKPFFVALNGFVATLCASVGAVWVLSSNATPAAAAAGASNKFLMGFTGYRGDGVKLLMLGMLSGYNAVSGLVVNLKKK